MPTTPLILDVAVAILRDASGCVLINERLGDDVHSGHWEFPGGKFEPGETPQQALRRECQEELGIEIEHSTPLITFTHTYPSKTVRLHVFTVGSYTGQARSLEGQPLRWVGIEALNAHDLLPADVAIVKALTLPEHCFVSPELRVEHDLSTITAPVTRHFSVHDQLMLQIRQHQLASEDYVELVKELLHSLGNVVQPERKLIVQVNTSVDVFKSLDAPQAINIELGLHLTAKRLKKFKRSEILGHKDLLIGASVHTDEELERALAKDLDYLILGMVKPSNTHPDREAIKWSGFSALIKDRAIPVFAIGGMLMDDVVEARQYGAQGIAGIGMFL